jgi:glyceraldehyde-3-phosphate dehydrogenase (NADP+)
MKLQDGVAAGAPMLLGGEWVRRDETIGVRNPLDGSLVGSVPAGTSTDVAAAIDAAERAQSEDFPLHARYDVLTRAAEFVEAEQEEHAWKIAREGSKTIREARR